MAALSEVERCCWLLGRGFFVGRQQATSNNCKPAQMPPPAARMSKWLGRGVKPAVQAMVKGGLPAPEQQELVRP